MAAKRAMLKPASPSGCAQPRITSSISRLSSWGTRSSAPLMAMAARSSGRVVAERAFGGAANRSADGADENGFGHWVLQFRSSEQ